MAEVENFTFELPDLEVANKAEEHGKTQQKPPKPKKEKKEEKNPTTPEEIQQQQCKIDIILKYMGHEKFESRIQHLTKGLNQEKLRKWSPIELDELLARIRASINSNMSGFLVKEGVFKGVGFIEHGVVNSSLGNKLYLTGYEQAMRSNSEFSDALDQLLIENGNFLTLSPTHRLIYALVSTAGIIHSKNATISSGEIELKVRGPTGFAPKKTEEVSLSIKQEPEQIKDIPSGPPPSSGFRPEFANIGVSHS